MAALGVGAVMAVDVAWLLLAGSPFYSYAGPALLVLVYALFRWGTGRQAATGAPVVLRYRRVVRSEQLERVRLQEREALARELHDTVAHHVSAIASRHRPGSSSPTRVTSREPPTRSG